MIAVVFALMMTTVFARSGPSFAGGRDVSFRNSSRFPATSRADLTGTRPGSATRWRSGIPSGLIAAARGSMREFWRTKLSEDYGVTAGEDLSEQSLMELDNYLYWVQKLKRDYDMTVLPGQYTGHELRDIDSRLYWCKKIKQDYGAELDWQQFTTAELVERDAREALARKLASAETVD